MESLIGRRFISNLSASANLAAVSRLICNSSINTKDRCICKRNFNSSSRLDTFGGELSSGSYTKGPKISHVFKKMFTDPKFFPTLYHMWMDEFKLWGQEWNDRLTKTQIGGLHKGEIDMLFTFETDAGIKKFLVITDKTNNQGYSTATFVRTQYETGLFSGFIDTRVPDDGTIRQAGFASILTKRLLKSFKRMHTYEWSNYTHLVLKVRGDGRNYLILLGCPDSLDVTYQDQFHYPLYTRGGPYWQIAKIPISNFYFTNKGRIQDQQQVMPDDACSRIGITLADGKTGPFKLEIEYFGLEFQPFHKKISPYELYAGKMIADV